MTYDIQSKIDASCIVHTKLVTCDLQSKTGGNMHSQPMTCNQNTGMAKHKTSDLRLTITKTGGNNRDECVCS